MYYPRVASYIHSAKPGFFFLSDAVGSFFTDNRRRIAVSGSTFGAGIHKISGCEGYIKEGQMDVEMFVEFYS
jgi:hypothetical protein